MHSRQSSIPIVRAEVLGQSQQRKALALPLEVFVQPARALAAELAPSGLLPEVALEAPLDRRSRGTQVRVSPALVVARNHAAQVALEALVVDALDVLARAFALGLVHGESAFGFDIGTAHVLLETPVLFECIAAGGHRNKELRASTSIL